MMRSITRITLPSRPSRLLDLSGALDRAQAAVAQCCNDRELLRALAALDELETRRVALRAETWERLDPGHCAGHLSRWGYVVRQAILPRIRVASGPVGTILSLHERFDEVELALHSLHRYKGNDDKRELLSMLNAVDKAEDSVRALQQHVFEQLEPSPDIVSFWERRRR